MILDLLWSLVTSFCTSPFIRHALKHLLLASTLFLLLLTILAFRIVLLLPPIRSKLNLKLDQQRKRQPGQTCKVALFLGSGGHTTELLLLLSHLDPQRYTPRVYLISSNDDFSREKALELERTWGGGDEHSSPNYTIISLPRARNVHQSWLTTPLSVIKSLMAAYSCASPSTSGKPIDHQAFADLLLMNGPGTCVPLLLSTYLRQAFSPSKPRPRSIYIESFARVKTLSLTGKIMQWSVDRFVRQWDGERIGGDGTVQDVTSESLSKSWLV